MWARSVQGSADTTKLVAMTEVVNMAYSLGTYVCTLHAKTCNFSFLFSDVYKNSVFESIHIQYDA